MESFFANLPPWAGTLSSWVIAIFTGGSFGLILNFWVNQRRVSVEADKVEGEIEARLRDHFSGELTRLTSVVTQARDDVEAAGERQRACEGREEALRIRVRKLEDQLTGVIRSLSVEGSLRVLDLTEEPSDDILNAAIHSLEAILTKRRKKREPKL